MVKIDLITGFLGSGKTTFIKKYVSYLISKGEKVGILENDYGAVNIDMLLLQELRGENCELEMVSGGCDADCHRRRFKTKLISMAMSGYTRVIVEPSGIYDVDEFYDTLHDEPLDNWYEIGNVIGIVDAKLDENLSDASDYLLASELGSTGMIIFSKVNQASKENIENTKRHIDNAFNKVKCTRKNEDFLIKDWDELSKEDYEKIENSGFKHVSFEKKYFDADEAYKSLYFMNAKITANQFKEASAKTFLDEKCGNVLRIKGFIKEEDGRWFEVNATKQQLEFKEIPVGQEVIIVIGEKLNEEHIKKYIGDYLAI